MGPHDPGEMKLLDLFPPQVCSQVLILFSLDNKLLVH